MKKIVSLALATVLALGLFTACGKKEDSTPSYDVNEILNKIDSAVPVTMPQDIPEDELTIMMGLDMADVKSYAGKITMMNKSADRILVIEAVDGKIDVIKKALESSREMIANSFNAEQYPELLPQSEKAQAGRVVVKGNYAILAIVGDDNVIADNGVDEAYKAVDQAIDEAFK